MLKQQEEMNMVYDKYGLKMSSGCLPSLLQLVFLFGLYPVVQNIPEYVTKVRNVYIPLVEKSRQQQDMRRLCHLLRQVLFRELNH